MSGSVTLVGAGPGDPDLLTVRGVRALEQADLVLYDALVDPRVVALAAKASRFFVGKRAALPSITQASICRLMIRAAQGGKRVVRLKGGDPFVFGRGGEEAIACREAGVAVEIVPGISSSIAGPASVGIPVTHRQVTPGFLVLSATPAEPCRAVLATLTPGAVTVVLMMSLRERASLAAFLAEHHWPAHLPAAIVLGATTPEAWSWRGTLGELPLVALPEDRRHLPGLLVLGEVVSLAEAIATGAESSEAVPAVPAFA
jgi:uroporphyrin-III C-methyltransferase